MDRTLFERVISAVEPHVASRLSPVDYEMAYQTRVAIDRIRFVLKNTEQWTAPSDQIREVNLQLLDALDRLESADHHFQDRFRSKSQCAQVNDSPAKNGNAVLEKRR